MSGYQWEHQTVKHLREVYELSESEALPTCVDGGYPVFYMADDGQTFCPSCASQTNAEPPIVYWQENYEDPDLFCNGCGARILSAYAEVDQ